MFESDPRLDALYRGTDYEVHWPQEPFVLHVDVASAALARCQQAHYVACSSYLTAWNPRSHPTDAERNAAAQLQLIAALTADGYRWIAGRGRDPRGAWSEESVLALGMDEAAALRYGRRFDQSAVLVAGAEGVPQLRWMAISDR
jgi:hypothetical protein